MVSHVKRNFTVASYPGGDMNAEDGKRASRVKKSFSYHAWQR